MYRNVLIPTDGSDGTGRAIAHGLTIADRFDATVHALSVIPEGPYGALEDDEGAAEAERNAERAVEGVDSAARDDGIDVETAIRRGTPDEEILEYATEHDVDMIVMGTHGRTGLDRVLVGSVTERVVKRADVPVVTVRLTETLGVTDADRATEIALEELAAEGYEDPAVLEEPHRTSASWIVPVKTEAARGHVHVDAVDGDVRIAMGGGDR